MMIPNISGKIKNGNQTTNQVRVSLVVMIIIVQVNEI